MSISIAHDKNSSIALSTELKLYLKTKAKSYHVSITLAHNINCSIQQLVLSLISIDTIIQHQVLA